MDVKVGKSAITSFHDATSVVFRSNTLTESSGTLSRMSVLVQDLDQCTVHVYPRVH